MTKKTTFAVLTALLLSNLSWSIKAGDANALRQSLQGNDHHELEKPNIVFILVDDMGYSDIGCYGGEVKTPHIDSLAERGIRYTQMYNTAKCMTSRASLLTGLYPQQCGMMMPNKMKNAVTLGEVLRRAGYRTLATGKHHGTDNLYDRGFDRYWGLRDGGNNYFNPGHQRLGEPKPAQKRPGGRYWANDSDVVRPYTPPEKDFYLTDNFTEKAIEYLEEYKGEDKPFFLYIAYTAPHDPLQAWPEDIAKYEDVYKVGYETIREARFEKMRKLGLIGPEAKLPEQQKEWDSLNEQQKAIEARKMAVYAAMTDRVDQKIGEVIAKLKELGEFDNTLIMFASDNGASAEFPEHKIHKEGERVGDGLPLEMIGTMEYWASLGSGWATVSNTPLRLHKNDSYEGGIRTPFIVHWPEGVAQHGQINKTFVGHFIDLMPTLIELTGASYPDVFEGNAVTPMQGISLLPTFKGDEFVRSTPLYWQWAHGGGVRVGDMKAVFKRRQWELFDMSKEGHETENLALQMPERMEAMKNMYSTWFERVQN